MKKRKKVIVFFGFRPFFINFAAEKETKNHLCICALRGLKGSIPLVEGDNLHRSLGLSPRMTEIISIRGKELSP